MNLIKKFNDFSMIEKILILFFILLIISLFCQFSRNQIEGFQDINNKIEIKDFETLNDDFYTKVFDVLTFNKIVSDFEVGNIITNTQPTERSIILDVGSQSGYLVNLFKEYTPNVIGVEKSKKLIDMAKKRYPSCENKFLNDDILNNHLFHQNSFTHIFCLNLNFYYIENKKQFLENCFTWLIPGGYVAINLVPEEKLNAKNNILNIRKNVYPDFVDPSLLLSDSIKFTDFVYKPKFKKLDSERMMFSEKFSFNNGKIRNQETMLYIKSIDDTIKIAKYLGFIILKQFSIKDKSGISSFLYIFQKPN
jgi:SAM-dependent methyltransferase